MATHSSIFARRIPRREECGRLQSVQSQRVKHNWAIMTLTFIETVMGTDRLRRMSTVVLGSWHPFCEGRRSESLGHREAAIYQQTWKSVLKLLFIDSFLAVLGLCCCTAFLELWRVGATLQLWCLGFSLWWLLSLWGTGSRAHGLQ